MRSTATSFIFCALGLCVLSRAHAQETDLFTKAPPEVDQALRARITTFYNAHITGKYREAIPIVAEDAQDDFLAAGKNTYKSCEISKISYSENFTKASVTTACKGEFRWRTESMPATMPLSSEWKLVDGQWFWYHVKRDLVETPFGLSRVTSGDSAQGPQQSRNTALPADPVAAAHQILNKVSIDKKEIELKGYETSQDEVHITNDLPGPIHVSVNSPGTTGLKIKLDKNDIPSGEKGTILFSYSVEDAKAICHDCFKPVKPPIVADVRIEPTAQQFAVKVNFAIPPELLKQLPPELQKKAQTKKPEQ